MNKLEIQLFYNQSACPMKLRILCLHGFAQNAEIFRVKTGGFRKLFKKVADFGKR
jgi:hypothetical protein